MLACGSPAIAVTWCRPEVFAVMGPSVFGLDRSGSPNRM
jgi:hypothetical protein